MHGCPKSFETELVANGQRDVAWVMVGRATEGVSVFNGGMAGLNGLVREWDIAAGDAVQIRLAGNLGVHDCLTSK